MCAIFQLLKVLAKSPTTIYFPIIKQFHKAPHRTLSPQWVAVQLLNNLAEYSFNVFFQIHISKNSYDITKPDVAQKTKALSTCHKREPLVRNQNLFSSIKCCFVLSRTRGVWIWCSAGVRSFGVQMPSNELIICPVTNSIMYFTRQQQSPWERSNTLVGR